MPSMPAADSTSFSTAQPSTLPALTGVSALAAATSGATSASANFLQLLAKLLGAAPSAETLPLEAPADPAIEKTDERTSSDEETSADDEEILPMLALVPGLCPARAEPAVALEIESARPQNPDGGAAGILDALQACANGSSFGADAAGDGSAANPAMRDPLESLRPLIAKNSGTADESRVPVIATAANDAAVAAPEVEADATAAPSVTDISSSALLDKLNRSIDAIAPSASDPAANAQASQLHAATPAHTHADNKMPAAELRSPVGTPAWRNELGTQLTWMAHQGLESASLRLSPEHLGPLEVRISMREGEASVWFGAANADTRSALDQSLPRLREMFASQGLVLADAGVFREAPRQQAKPGQWGTNQANNPETADSTATAQAAVRHLRLLDTYV